MTDFHPRPYYITCTRKGQTHRVGWARTTQEAHKVIIEDRIAMRETYGGLMSPESDADIKARVYRIWRAEWTEVTA